MNLLTSALKHGPILVGMFGVLLAQIGRGTAGNSCSGWLLILGILLIGGGGVWHLKRRYFFRDNAGQAEKGPGE